MAASIEYTVPEARTVPHLLPESEEFARMPKVLATGYLIGLVEWACMCVVRPYLGVGERTVGTYVDLSHEAPTPPGTDVNIYAELVAVKNRRLDFDVIVDDRHTILCRGRHRRSLIDVTEFERKLAALRGDHDT